GSGEGNILGTRVSQVTGGDTFPRTTIKLKAIHLGKSGVMVKAELVFQRAEPLPYILEIYVLSLRM
uniref:Dirigent protein n=2 Tax=Bursaphelenchus xylophilus TaxID=6326 RepID=A0A1I7SH08_BURXY